MIVQIYPGSHLRQATLAGEEGSYQPCFLVMQREESSHKKGAGTEVISGGNCEPCGHLDLCPPYDITCQVSTARMWWSEHMSPALCLALQSKLLTLVMLSGGHYCPGGVDYNLW